MGEYCNLCNLIHFLSQTPAHREKQRYFPFRRGSVSNKPFPTPAQPHGTPTAAAGGTGAHPHRSPPASRGHRSAEGRLRQGCSSPLSPPAALSPSLAFSKTVLATMFSSSIDELGQRRQRHCSRTSLRGAESPGDHPPPAPSALSPRASSPPACPPAPPRSPGGGGAPRTAGSAAPRYSILRPAGSPGGLRARALLPPSPGGVAPRSGPAAPRRRRPRRAGHAGTCSPGAAPPHLALVPQPRRVRREGRPLSASGRGRARAGARTGAGQSVPGGGDGCSPPGMLGAPAVPAPAQPSIPPDPSCCFCRLSCPRSPGLPGPARRACHPARVPTLVGRGRRHPQMSPAPCPSPRAGASRLSRDLKSP